MKAIAVFPGQSGTVHLADLKKPNVTDVPNGRGVLVRILKVGVDGTDKEINAAEYGAPPNGYEFLVIGHEGFGQVEEVGPNVTEFKSGDYVFSSKYGVRPVSAFSAQKRLLDQAMKKALRKAFSSFRVHDVRRSVRTHFSAIPNVSDLVRELAIGHTKPGLHAIYDQHNYLSEKQYLFDAWSKRLRGIIGDADTANVVELMPSATVA